MTDKTVFKEIEFYLPQLAHWAIHFGSDSTSYKKNNLHLVMLLCCHSMHIALQFSFLVRAYLEGKVIELRHFVHCSL